MSHSWIVCTVLLATLVSFVTGFLRYDLTALMALLILTFAGVIPQDEVFTGFSSNAVIGVAAVLVISSGLERAGLVDRLERIMSRTGSNQTIAVLTMCLAVAFCSAFINNVGALALFMPLGISLARKHNRSPSFILLPMAYASLLGGMTTLIGTPPNLLVAEFRAKVLGKPFQMFDFTPVGITVAFAGIVYLAVLGWRLIPFRKSSTIDELFDIDHYLSEVVVMPDSLLVGKMLSEAGENEHVAVLAVQRENLRRNYSAAQESLTLQENDVLTVRADPASLRKFMEQFGVQLHGANTGLAAFQMEDRETVEAVVIQNGNADGASARRLRLRELFDANLLAVARRGTAVVQSKLKNFRFSAGDILLLDMSRNSMTESLSRLGLLPLARRDLPVTGARHFSLAILIFAAAIAATVFGGFSGAMAFTSAAVLFVVAGILSVRDAYSAIDWPTLILMGAMIPVGNSFESSGAAAVLAQSLANLNVASYPSIMTGAVLLTSMVFTAMLNNAAAVIVLCPIAISLADKLGVGPDAFLLAVSIGASCDFVTPIGHQCNTLVMGPGGYRFSDYFRTGILLQLLIILTTVPMLSFLYPPNSKSDSGQDPDDITAKTVLLDRKQ